MNNTDVPFLAWIKFNTLREARLFSRSLSESASRFMGRKGCLVEFESPSQDAAKRMMRRIDWKHSGGWKTTEEEKAAIAALE